MSKARRRTTCLRDGCGKHLTGRQRLFCSKACHNAHWASTHPERRAELHERYQAARRLPPELRPQVTLRLADIARLDAVNPALAEDVRTGIAAIRVLQAIA